MIQIRRSWLPLLMLLASLGGCSSKTASEPGSGNPPSSPDQPAPPALPSPPPVGGKVTTLQVGYAVDQSADQYITFGQVFVPGHIPAGNSLTAAYDDGTPIPIQVDAKATNADGSLRHAVITLKTKGTAAGTKSNVNLIRAAAATSDAPIPVASLLGAGFDSVITANIGGVVYTASAANLLVQPNVSTWLSGSMATEWIASGPLKASDGTAHPHLTARFEVRAYEGLGSARVSVGIDNDYSFVASPSDQTYTLSVTVGSQTVIAPTPITHWNQARWRRVFYWGTNPQEIIQHETAYLLASRALPNYDATITPSATYIQGLSQQLSTSRDIMDIGIVTASFEATGGRPEIGILPGWTVDYLLSQDPVAKDIVLTMGELAGTFQVHWRNELTDHPITLDEYPYMTLEGDPGDAVDPATGKSEAFPTCVTCNSPNAPDTAHQPDFAYVPYLVTGDYWYLEEMQFWAGQNLLAPNPAYRGQGLGVLSADQVRGQAWTLRSVAFAAYLTPDADPLKPYFVSRLENNITYYNGKFTDPSYNKLGIDVEGNAIAYNGRGIAPWMDNFFTSVLGMMSELGFTDVAPALAYKTKFPVGMMVDPDFCWILSTSYYLYIVPDSGTDIYTTLDQVWQNSNKTSATYGENCNSAQMASTLMLPSTNYLIEGTDDPEGYTAVYQAALAYSLTIGAPDSLAAWTRFQTRANVADYTSEPQFAIVPRQ